MKHLKTFESLYESPLVKWDEHGNRDYQTEEMLYKSRLEKTLKECQSFKICFYQSIDHLINMD